VLIDLQLVTPYLLLILATLISAIGWYLRSVGNKLSEVGTKLATLIEHTVNNDNDIADIRKYHDEIIDLKVASAELDTRTKGMQHQLDLMYPATTK